MAYASSSTQPNRIRPSRKRMPTSRQRTLSASSTSSEEAKSQEPTVEDIRRIRAEYYSKQPEDRRKDSEKRMAKTVVHRTATELGGGPTKESTVSVREIRATNHTGHRHRRRKSTRQEGHDDTVYVYRYLDEEREETKSTSVRPLRQVNQGTGSSFISDRLRALRAPTFRAPGQILEHGHGVRHLDVRDLSERRHSYHAAGPPSPTRTTRRIDFDRPPSATTSRPTTRRTTSVRESRPPSTSRPNLARSQTSASRRQSVPIAQPDQPHIDTDSNSISSSIKKVDRSPNLFGAIFGPPKSAKPVKPQEQVQCLTCLSEDIPISKSAKLSCGHRMCHTCLRRIFTMSVTDPAHMPPKCCTADHIPLKHVDKLFDLKFKMKWNRKYQEYTTKNRTYCPAKGCGEWIKPANIHLDTSGGVNGGRKYGRCGRCRTKVCVTCNGKWHSSRECPKDEATARFAEIAKLEGWQRCYNCSAMVELKEGCNHMTCRCQAEFCMICGVKWKSCDCPWFNYQAVENDRLNHMNIPQARRGAAAPRVADMPRGYNEELEQRREQERRDEAFARRMQVLGLDDDADAAHNLQGAFFAVGNAAGHFLNERFVRQEAVPARYPPPPPPPPPVQAAMPPPPPPPRVPAALPPTPPTPPRILRQHSTASQRYNDLPGTRASERVVPRRVITDFGTEAAVHEPDAEDAGPATRPAGKARRHSAMAGLTKRTDRGRVNEWRRHVEDGGEEDLEGAVEV